mmetsp:Transcript_9953/g.20302  ORF Transcript_9953/g.20302 Transcript_9953/m.20302 type:complete len:845 (-) Transcript_9953:102-2636(-)
MSGKRKTVKAPNPTDLVEKSIETVRAGVNQTTKAFQDAEKKIEKIATDLAVIPPLEPIPLPWFILLTIITFGPIAAYGLGFSGVGYGRDCMKFAIDHSEIGNACLGVVFMVLSALYILDFSYWESSCMRAIRATLFTLSAIGFLVGVFFSAANYPFAPLIVFMLVLPMYLLMFRHLIFKSNFRNYISWLPGPLFFWAVVNGIAWTVWTFSDDDHEWSMRVRDNYALSVGCPPNFDPTTGYPVCKNNYNPETKTWNCYSGKDAEGNFVPISSPNAVLNGVQVGGCGAQCGDVYDTCLDSFMIWSTPLFTSLVYFFASFVFVFLNPDHKNASPQAFMKMFLCICFLFWVASSLAASNAGITNALMAFIVFALLMGALVAIGVHGTKSVKEDVETNFIGKFREKYSGYGNFFKGLFILTCLPIVFGYWGIAFVNQCIRKLRLPLTKQLDDEDKGLAFTLVATKQRKEIMKWEWTPVITMGINIGIFVQIMGILVTKITYLLLAMLRQKIEDEGWEWPLVSFLMIGIGICMFMLPPVPGVPIYFMCGLMLVKVCEPDMGTGGGTAYCITLGLVLKLIACAIQQKCIGETMRNNVGIRQMCNINSDMMRTMKVILMQPGITMAKCSILIGGPDWPTSVMCGIMGLDLIPILIGTIPVVVLIAPTVASGLFVYLGETKEWASTLSTVCLSATGMAQSGSMLMAAYYLEKAVNEEKDALEAIPIDQEVKEADDKAAKKAKIFHDVTKWGILPRFMKAFLLSALSFMIISCYLTMVFSTNCFEPFEMTSKVADLPGGKAMNLFKGGGWIAISLFALSTIQVQIFNKWANKRVAVYEKDHPEGAGGDNEMTNV